MTNYSGKVDHDIDVTGDLELAGQMNGNITVHEGGRLRLHGQTNSNVMVLDGGFLHQSGQLNGVLTCRGWAEITGQINGKVVVEGGVVLVAEGVNRNSDGRSLLLDSTGHWVQNERNVSIVTESAPRWRWNQDGSMTRLEQPDQVDIP